MTERQQLPPLTEVPLFRATVVFGSPMVFAMAMGALFNLADLWIVGMMDNPEIAIAAVTIPSLVNSIPMIIFNGIVNAMIALVARHHGLGSRTRANVAAGQGLLPTPALAQSIDEQINALVHACSEVVVVALANIDLDIYRVV